MITVLMSAYNASPYLKEAIESILNQTYSDFEFIIINDGSSDDTERIINSYNDKRIKYIRNESNLGLIASLNKGIENASGGLIARMDADDIALPERLATQNSFFERFPDTIIIGSDYYLMHQNRLSRVTNVNDSDYLKGILLFAPCFCHPSVMFKKEINGRLANYKKEYIHAEDYKLWTDLSQEGMFGNINTPLLKYRAHNSQISFQNRAAQHKISQRIREEYYSTLGFSFSASELNSLHTIGDNIFITSVEVLKEIESALASLKVQNQKLRIFNSSSFDKLILKFWSDSCGYTNLGIKAFKVFLASGLTNNASAALKARVLAKSVLRKYRSSLQ